MTTVSPQLDDLGDALERATAADLAAKRRRRAPRKLALTIAALAVAIPGLAFAANALISSEEVAGADVEAERAPERVGELGRSVLDVSLAARELGWRPERALDEGLAATWAWFSRLPA